MDLNFTQVGEQADSIADQAHAILASLGVPDIVITLIILMIAFRLLRRFLNLSRTLVMVALLTIVTPMLLERLDLFM